LEENNTLRSLDIQRSIATNRLHIEQGSYLPQVALVASQRLWDEGLNNQLFPRTFVGVGVSWTLFDGLGREKRVARSRATLRTTNATRTEVESQLSIAVERLYQNIQTAISEFATLTTTEQLAEDLVRTRRKAFAEGVATSTEVVDAEVVLSEARLGKAASLYAIDTALATLLMLCGQDNEYTNYINNQAYEEQ
jgi:outer membrane protein TolC